VTESFFVACTPGLEAPLSQELSGFGLDARVVTGGCEVSGAPEGSVVLVNVQSRLASRVLWKLGQLESPASVARLAVGQLVGSGPFKLSISEEPGARSAVPAEVWRNAAVKAWGPLGEGPELSFRLSRAGCVVSVDTSGALLYLRGARQETGKAPLRETLASGVLRVCGWKPGESLWDVMCGSGTLVIEATEQALGLQPGRARPFAFQSFASHRPESFAEVTKPGPPVSTWVRGSDLNAGALGVARRNAKRAGVFEALELVRLDATTLVRPSVAPGLVIANLPYGKRVGQRFELHGLYQGVGAALRRSLSGWRFGFLLADGPEALGLPIEQKFPVKNGGLWCQVVTGRIA
jgi:putative N6-adenine-specific DNA methylase